MDNSRDSSAPFFAHGCAHRHMLERLSPGVTRKIEKHGPIFLPGNWGKWHEFGST
jgi:hypothetical protein